MRRSDVLARETPLFSLGWTDVERLIEAAVAAVHDVAGGAQLVQDRGAVRRRERDRKGTATIPVCDSQVPNALRVEAGARLEATGAARGKRRRALLAGRPRRCEPNHDTLGRGSGSVDELRGDRDRPRPRRGDDESDQKWPVVLSDGDVRLIA